VSVKTLATGPKKLEQRRQCQVISVLSVFPKKGVNGHEPSEDRQETKGIGTAPSLLKTLQWRIMAMEVLVLLALSVQALSGFLQEKGFQKEIVDSLKGMVDFFFLFKMYFNKKGHWNVLVGSQSCRKICPLKRNFGSLSQKVPKNIEY